MADYDPALPGGAWDENGDYEVTEGNEQEDIEQHSSDEVQAEYSVDPTQHASGDIPSPDGATDDVGEYDPESVTSAVGMTLQPAADQVPLRPSPQRAAKQKPRTAGGFLVGDSDSEDDGAPRRASGAASQSAAPRSPPQGSVAAKKSTVAPSNADPAPQVNAVAELPAGRQENGNAAAPPGSAAATGPLPQIPVDRTTQLEDRVRDDPRGAMDSWLALIAHYRSKGDLAQIRQVYDRFLAVFPQAVSCDPSVPEPGCKN
jgi:cleavage stimulation factor subunit 3